MTRCVGVLQQGHRLAHERGIDLVQGALEADGAVPVHAALELEAKQGVKIDVGPDHPDLACREGPLVKRRVVVEATVGGVVILAFDPRPESAVDRVEAAGVGGAEQGQELSPAGPKKTLYFPLPSWLIGSRMDKTDAELGAHQREMPGAVVRAVVDIQA